MARPFEPCEICQPGVVTSGQVLIEKRSEVAARPVQITAARRKTLAVMRGELPEVVITDAAAYDRKSPLQRRPKSAGGVISVHSEILRRRHGAGRCGITHRRGEGSLQLTQRGHEPLQEC